MVARRLFLVLAASIDDDNDIIKISWQWAWQRTRWASACIANVTAYDVSQMSQHTVTTTRVESVYLQGRRSRDSITDPLLAGENPAYRLYRFMPPRTYGLELRRPEKSRSQVLARWPHILGRRCLEYDETHERGLLFHTVPRVLETADGHLSPCVQT